MPRAVRKAARHRPLLVDARGHPPSDDEGLMDEANGSWSVLPSQNGEGKTSLKRTAEGTEASRSQCKEGRKESRKERRRNKTA